LGTIAAQVEPSEPVAIAFRRTWLRGYRAWLDGKEVPVRGYLGMVPLVELPPGDRLCARCGCYEIAKEKAIPILYAGTHSVRRD
jgi:hypothetical protein